jgi:phage host-nuclease inhibitor protein Gam
MDKPPKKPAKKSTSKTAKLEADISTLKEEVAGLTKIIQTFLSSKDDILKLSQHASVFIEEANKKIEECLLIAKRNSIKTSSNIQAFKDQLDTLVNDHTLNAGSTSNLAAIQVTTATALTEMQADMMLLFQEIDIVKSLTGITDKVNLKIAEKLQKDKKDHIDDNGNTGPA